MIATQAFLSTLTFAAFPSAFDRLQTVKVEATPRAAELVAKHNGEGAGKDLLGGLMSAIGGGIMGMGEISTLAKATMAVAREYAGADVVDEVVASVPGLSQFV